MDRRGRFAATRAARNAWEELGRHNELLPPERFASALAPVSAYYDHSSDWLKPEPQKRGAESRALQDLINGSCQGWEVRPTGTELYEAFRAREPTTRQQALLYAWFIEGTTKHWIEAWAQQAYSDRQLVASIHRIGFTKTDRPYVAQRIRFLNARAVR